MSDEPILVSACLLGNHCRFDGGAKAHEGVQAWLRGRRAIPVCPEQFGGLPTPRPKHELLNGRVISEHGADRTQQFNDGAEESLRVARMYGCRIAVLKARSPSCGRGEIYDGSFSGKLVPGDGVAAAMLVAAGLKVMTEDEV